MYKISSKFIYKIYKSAFEDIQEFLQKEDWIKSHMESYPDLKKFKRYSDVVKSMPFPDFRKPSEISKSQDSKEEFLVPNPRALDDLFENFFSNYLDYIKDFLIEITNMLSGDSRKMSDIFLDGLISFYDAIDSEYILNKFKTEKKFKNIFSLSKDIRFEFTKLDGNKKIVNLQAGMFIPQALETFSKEYCRYAPNNDQPTPDNPKPVQFKQKLELFKNVCSAEYVTRSEIYKQISFWLSDKFKLDLKSKLTEEFEVVFTTQPQDVLTMSTRSIWTSCQNLLNPENTQRHRAIWSAVSPYIGIIYLTNKKDYQSRGEEMIARSLVAYLESSIPGQPPVIALMMPYTIFNKNTAMKEFYNALKDVSPIEVIPITTPPNVKNNKLQNHYFPTEQKQEFTTPYFDTTVNYGLPRKK